MKIAAIVLSCVIGISSYLYGEPDVARLLPLQWHYRSAFRVFVMGGQLPQPLPEEPTEPSKREAHARDWLAKYWENPQEPAEKRLSTLIFCARSYYGAGEPHLAEQLLDRYEFPLGGSTNVEYLALRYCIALFGKGDRMTSERYLAAAEKIAQPNDRWLNLMLNARYSVMGSDEMKLRQQAFRENESKRKTSAEKEGQYSGDR